MPGSKRQAGEHNLHRHALLPKKQSFECLKKEESYDQKLLVLNRQSVYNGIIVRGEFFAKKNGSKGEME